MKAFIGARQWFGDLDVEDAARLITAASDVALVLSAGDQGVIRDVSFGNEELAAELAEQWVGKPWIDTVTSESRSKVEGLLRDATAKGPTRWRQVNHRSLRGGDVPVIYTAVRLGDAGKVIAIGRSMRPIATLQQQLIDAQQAMEREYARLRQMETRHQLMFQLSAEPVIIIDAATRRIVEINPAAAQLLGDAAQRLIGRVFPLGVDDGSRQELDTLLAAVKASGRSGSTAVKLDSASSSERNVSVSLFREDKSAYLLVRFAPESGTSPTRQGAPRTASKVLDVVARLPDGFVVTELDGRIQFANRAFLDIVQLASEEQARAESLDRWLGRPGIDFGLLTTQLRERGVLRLFATTLRGEYGSTTDVEISGVSVPDGEAPCCGFTIRDVSKRLKIDTQAGLERPRSVQQLTELVGRVPLRELVRESTDMIERLCIEAALELTQDNRASAAEILGLSRQSLYAKLRRYGLGDLDPVNEEVAVGTRADS